MFDLKIVENILAGDRIPIEFRKDKQKASELLNYVKNVKHNNHELNALSRWVNAAIDFTSEVKSIADGKKEQTFDLTVPEGSSYVINGMVCHNTLNLPKDVTTEEVEEVCMKAWELGCKGVTVYRIGSRDAVISKQSETHEQTQEIFETKAPKRPKVLTCDIQRVTVQGETYLVLVGLMNGKPYEVFAGLQEHVLLPKKIKTGSLVKNGKGKDGVVTYNLSIQIDDEELVFKDIVNLFDNKIHGAFTRTISLALRHGTPVQFLCEQLRKDKNSDITSFSNCIARVLKSYVPDGVSSSSEKTCPTCNSTGLIYQQGCVQCNNCGWSKC